VTMVVGSRLDSEVLDSEVLDSEEVLDSSLDDAVELVTDCSLETVVDEAKEKMRNHVRCLFYTEHSHSLVAEDDSTDDGVVATEEEEMISDVVEETGIVAEEEGSVVADSLEEEDSVEDAERGSVEDSEEDSVEDSETGSEEDSLEEIGVVNNDDEDTSDSVVEIVTALDDVDTVVAETGGVVGRGAGEEDVLHACCPWALLQLKCDTRA
jgi:hypothetical protein